MDIFELKIDPEVFRKTNDAWNRLQLNSPWSVGYVSTLIKNQSFDTKESWEDYYYSMGWLRTNLLRVMKDDTQHMMNRITPPDNVGELDDKLLSHNYEMGRTQDDLKEKAQLLKNQMDKEGVEITLEECVECVRYRVICETWNGIVHTEEEVMGTLRRDYPALTFKQSSGHIDYTYAVDYEVFMGMNKIMGIQIKPASYAGDTPYLQRAKAGNQQKFDLYKQDMGIPVVTLMASRSGGIMGNRHYSVVSMIFNTYQQLMDGEHDLI
jgi:hypothetical protein